MRSLQLNLEKFSPCFLVAAPQLRDPHFYHTVILLLEYHQDGAMGLVINRPLNVTLGSVQSPQATIDKIYQEDSLWYGGPLASDHILCLYEATPTAITGDTEVSRGIAVAAADSLLASTMQQRQPFPSAYRILAGHAGWQPQQLDEEIHAGTWLVAPIQPEMIFSNQPDNVWNAAMRRLGVNPMYYHDTPTRTVH